LRRRRGWWSAGAVLWLLLGPRLVQAQSVDAIELRVTPDARGCITEAGLRARVARLDVQAKDAYGLALALDASREPAVLEVRRNDVVIATRRFDALPERCAERLQTIALVMTLAIEHAIMPEELAESEPQPAPAPERGVPDATPAQRAAKPEPAVQPVPVESNDARVERQEPALRTLVSVGAAYGLLPELSGALAVGVELPSPGLRIGLGAVVTSEASTSLADGTVLTRLVGARAYGCASGEGLALDLQACAGVTLGVLSGSGRDYAPSADATGTLFAPLVRLAARYPARGLLSVGPALEGFVHVVRPELQVSGNAGGASSLPLFGAALSLEAVLAIP
jgi:hypothetical protein